MPKRIINVDRAKESTSTKRKRAPASSPEGRESQIISMTYDLAEKQIAEGTASSQTMHHFLEAGSTKRKLEKEKLLQENALLKAKIEALKSAKSTEELYANALDAMRKYNGSGEEDYEH